MTTTSLSVTQYQGGSDDSELHRIWEDGFASLHRAYSLPLSKFSQLLAYPSAVTFIAKDNDNTVGFAITYTIRSGSAANPAAQHLKGTVSAFVVDPSAQGRGVGTMLLDAARAHLTARIRDSFKLSSPPATESIIQLGSVFPRIFPGLPALDVFKPARAWFEKRGWPFGKDLSIDLYGEVPTGVDQEKFLEAPRRHGITFRPAAPADEEQVMVLQKQFDSFTGWPDMFPVFFKAGRAEDIHLAINKDGQIIGATFAALTPSPLHDVLAYPDTLGKRCGAIACVGVSSSSRGEGAGVGMVASALLDLERRGADGCFIDWVSMKGFYERFGLEQWEAPYWDSAIKVTAAPAPLA